MKNYIIFFIILPVLILIGCQHSKPIIQPEKPFVFQHPGTPELKRVSLTPYFRLPFVTIAAVGDIMLGNHTSYYIQKYGVDYPFDSTKKVFAETHLTFGNLEAPFTTRGIAYEKKFTFRVSPDHAIGLKQAGFDVVTLANNHMLDYGMAGLGDCLTVLDSIGIAHCGAGLNLDQACEPTFLETNGYRIAVIGYSMTFPREFWATDTTGGTCYPHHNIFKSTIQHSDSTADFTIVSFHWGAEGSNYPKDYQVHFARMAIDYGADLILGHHPHVLQGIEVYKNRLIAYSLGNFSFSSYSKKATESIILKVFLTDNGLLFAKIIPISVNNIETAFQPKILSGAAADTVISHLKKYSESLNSQNIIDEKGFIWGNRFTFSDTTYQPDQHFYPTN